MLEIKEKKSVAVINKRVIVKLIALIALVGAISSCVPICVNTIVTEVVSPNRKLVATVYKRDCGATTLENTQVTIRKQTESFNPKKQKSVFIIETEKIVTVTWESNSLLKILFTDDGKIFRQEIYDENVKIMYVQQM